MLYPVLDQIELSMLLQSTKKKFIPNENSIQLLSYCGSITKKIIPIK